MEKLVLTEEEQQAIVALRAKKERKTAREKAVSLVSPAKEALAAAKQALQSYIESDPMLADLQKQIDVAKASLDAVYVEHPELKTVYRSYGSGSGGTRKTGAVIVTDVDGNNTPYRSLNAAWKAVRSEKDVTAIPWSRADACFGSHGLTVALAPITEIESEEPTVDEEEEG